MNSRLSSECNRRNHCVTVVKSIALFSAIIFCQHRVFAEVEQETVAGIPIVTAEQEKSEVVIRLYENQDLPMGNGFSVFVEGWQPNDSVSIEAYSPNEEKVTLLKDGATLPISSDGKTEFSIPYSHKKLYFGRWMLVVSGKSGAHAHYFNVPKN